MRLPRFLRRAQHRRVSVPARVIDRPRLVGADARDWYSFYDPNLASDPGPAGRHWRRERAARGLETRSPHELWGP